MTPDDVQAWVRKMRVRDQGLRAEEIELFAGMLTESAIIPSRQDIVRAGERPDRSSLLVEGWAARYIDLPDGRRQILALHLAGDFVDLHSFPLRRMDHAVMTLTPCRFAYAPHAELRHVTETQPHLTRLLWLGTLIDAAILRQWLVSAGQRSALERLAHLFSELALRLELIGAPGDRFSFPLSQAESAHALGISIVHTNRVVQELRRLGLVAWRGSLVEILDRDGLHKLGGFDPTYLELEPEPR